MIRSGRPVKQHDEQGRVREVAQGDTVSEGVREMTRSGTVSRGRVREMTRSGTTSRGGDGSAKRPEAAR